MRAVTNIWSTKFGNRLDPLVFPGKQVGVMESGDPIGEALPNTATGCSQYTTI